MNQAHRFLLVAIALVLAGGVVAVAQHKNHSSHPAARPTPSAPATLGGPCIAAQPRKSMPSFFPKNLPLPPGSYAAEVPPPFAGSQRAVVIAKGTLRDFIVFILSEWPKQGWVLGRGDAEPGEADDSFRDQRAVNYGAFKARAIMCDTTTTWVFFVFAHATPAPNLGTSSPSSKPLVSGSASPR